MKPLLYAILFLCIMDRLSAQLGNRYYGPGVFNIKYPVSYKLHGIHGCELLHGEINSDKVSIRISGIPNGIYLIKFVGSGLPTQMVVVQR